MMTDPIADMLTRIRNANAVEKPVVEIAATKLKVAIAKVLKDEGFIADYSVGKYVFDEAAGGNLFKEGADLSEAKVILRVYMKYGPEGEKVIRHIRRSSRPGRRYYQGKDDIKKILDGLGISILSTSRGVLSNRQARKMGVGGEVLCVVW
jgi:small subunit ribosomal protein S8